MNENERIFCGALRLVRAPVGVRKKIRLVVLIDETASEGV